MDPRTRNIKNPKTVLHAGGIACKDPGQVGTFTSRWAGSFFGVAEASAAGGTCQLGAFLIAPGKFILSNK